MLGSAFAIRLVVAAGGRSEDVALLVAAGTKAEIETGIEELACQSGTPTETVDGPRLGGMQLLAEPKDLVVGPHAVEGEGDGVLFAQSHLRREGFMLESKGGCPAFRSIALQGVKAALSELHDFRKRQEKPQGLKMTLQIEVGLRRPPRMDADGIQRSFGGTRKMPLVIEPLGGRQQHLLRQTNDACSRRCVEPMCVKVKVHDHHLVKGF